MASYQRLEDLAAGTEWLVKAEPAPTTCAHASRASTVVRRNRPAWHGAATTTTRVEKRAMSRVQYTYGVPSTSFFVQLTSTGTTNSQTATPPAGAVGFFIQVGTTSGYITLDGSTPSSSNGLLITKDQLPMFIPVAQTIILRSSAGANSVASIQWVR